ncbi:MAG: hypothetical protein COV44_04790 [Deltaproteobacteria bacterium CG11_big_fil_rev_8_21_14_0_20_45_16]|nr:MAG: hypothetical protein COV44_04790 [Deltaproteobacteria bacterium CG11_big_fil_rev_8_21_14_0_20_45_16]
MIPLQKEITSIGRKQADIILDDPKVSSLHAEIHRNGNNFVFKDLGSTNGSFVNRRAAKEITLVDQDVIEFGMTTLCFFADIRDFHGQVEEVTVSTKTKPITQTVDIENLRTSTQTIVQPTVVFKWLKGELKQKEYRLQKPHILLGRGEADIVILDLDASRKHAMVEVLSPSNIFLRDLGSTNGTSVNSKKVSSIRLKSGDIIQVGETMIEFSIEESSK